MSTRARSLIRSTNNPIRALTDLDKLCFTCPLPECSPKHSSCPRLVAHKAQRGACVRSRGRGFEALAMHRVGQQTPTNKGGRQAIYPISIALQEIGISLADIAHRLGVYPSCVGDVARRTKKSARVAQAIADALGKDRKTLFGY